MDNWQEVKLGDLIAIKHGYAFKGEFFSSKPTDNILLTPGNFNIGGGFKADKFKYYRGDIPSDFILNKGDIIVTMTDLSQSGDTLGYAAKVPFIQDKRLLHNQRLGLITVLSKLVESDFIYWTLRTKTYQSYIISSATGSTVKHTSPSLIRSYSFVLPSLQEQKIIATILNGLDDKIDLLYRQNKTLEALAETLFRQWFIEEADSSWQEGTLGDIANNIREGIPHHKITSGTKYIGLEHIDRKCIALHHFGLSDTVQSNKFQFREDDILFGKLRPYFHKVCFAPFEGICSTDILVVRPKKSQYLPFVLFAFFQSDVVEYANIGSEGTRMPRTNWEILSGYPLLLPPASLVEKFNKTVEPFLLKIKYNLTQIRTLTSLRDTLLPKLMSGEVRVGDAGQVVESAVAQAVEQPELPFS